MRIDRTDFFQLVRNAAVRLWDQLKQSEELSAPWYQLFMQVQSPRHVLSELLQNADDAGATWAKAVVRDGVFTFEHNGEDFQRDHLESLCRFGKSNKRNLHTIGFRGIGFKSTFSLGPNVEVFTPTLSFVFNQDRFTQPDWVEDGLDVDGSIVVRVHIDDLSKEDALHENFSEWIENPASLLFFKNLMELQIEDQKIHRVSQGVGPESRSEWFDLAVNDQPHRVLLIQSSVEPFPDDAVEEIKKERMDKEVTLPPASVDIVLGLTGAQRVYSVLPTEAKPNTPFSCNGPFMQDPARTSIKDPSLSPTNRWLLKRVGQLAASVMDGWLRNSELTLRERAKAYDLMPDRSVEVRTVSDKAASVVSDGFSAKVAEKIGVLTTEGEVAAGADVLAIPKSLYGVWDDSVAVKIFGLDDTDLAAKEIPERILGKIMDWDDRFSHISRESVRHTLIGSDIVPVTNSRDGLLRLWAFFEPDISKRRYDANWKRLKIIPVIGSNRLFDANSVIRVKSDVGEGCVSGVLKKVLNFADGQWIDILQEGVRKGETTQGVDDKLLSRLSKANIVLDSLQINRPTPTRDLTEKVVEQIYSCDDHQLVVLTHFLASIDADVPSDFPYLCADGFRRKVKEGVLFLPSADAIHLLPEDWLSRHELSSNYQQESACCTREVWNSWASSIKSHMSRFVKPRTEEVCFYDKPSLGRFIRERGCISVPEKQLQRDEYLIKDYDFEPDIWEYWHTLSNRNEDVWVKVVGELVQDSARIFAGQIFPDVLQVGRTGRNRILDMEDALVSAWIYKLRVLPCLPSTYLQSSYPSDLFVRNRSTEPLVGVEDFVHADFDIEINHNILNALGTKNRPQDLSSLLMRLRTVVHLDDPNLSDLIGWYKAIDSIVAGISQAEFEELNLEEIFKSENLVFSNDEKWMSSTDLYIEEDGDFPDEPVIYKAVNNLPLWGRIGIQRRPSFKNILNMLDSFEHGIRISSDRLERMRRWLTRDPQRVVDRLSSWLTLDHTWEHIDHLQWEYHERKSSIRSELFSSVLSSVADTSMLRPEDIPHQLDSLKSLKYEINYQVTSIQREGDPVEEIWISSIGGCLSRIEIEDSEEDINSLGSRMLHTKVQKVRSIELTPYLNDVPAGVAITPEFYWSNHEFFARQSFSAANAELVNGELTRTVFNDEIRSAIRFVSMRDVKFIEEFFESHFTMKSVSTVMDDIDVSVLNGGRVETPEEKVVGSKEHIEVSAARLTDIEDTIPDHTKDLESSSMLTIDQIPHEETVPSGRNSFTDTVATPNYFDDFSELDHPTTLSTPQANEEEELDNGEKEPSVKEKRVSKSDAFHQFMTSEGFVKDSTGIGYVNSSGELIQKSDDIFPYERVTTTGSIIFYYHTLDSLEKGVHLPPDVYIYLKEYPEKVNVILLNEHGNHQSLSGQAVMEQIENRSLGIYPESYRLITE